MMLVNHHPVKASLGAILQLLKVHAVELLGPFGAEMRIGKHQVIVAKLSGRILGIRCIPHLGEEVDFLDHARSPNLPQASWYIVLPRTGGSRRVLHSTLQARYRRD